MRVFAVRRVTILLALLCAAGAHAARRAGPLPPSAVIFSDLYNFGVQPTYSGSVSVPQDGAWLYGAANSGSSIYQDCVHHYEVDLSPSTLSPNYSPLLKLGAITEADAAVCSSFFQCYTCQVDWAGQRTLIDYTTSNAPAWLPPGSGSAILKLNSGGLPALLSFSLNQVNMDAMQSMSVYEATANDLPVEASPEDINSRAYIAASDDRVPLVPRFLYGTDYYPAPPQPYITFVATWDTGEQGAVEVKNPYPGNLPGNQILLVNIPKMKTGNHKVTITANLPSGKTFSAPPYDVFVYNVALETAINNTVVPAPVSFTRAETVTFRIQQQDTHGKTIKVTKADWTFRNLDPTTPVTINSVDESGFPVDSREWTGTMSAQGLVSVSLTIQAGKTARTSHAALSVFAAAKARTDAQWSSTPRSLCEDCWTDLGIRSGGYLKVALVFPSHANILADAPFPLNFGGGLALGMSGERHSYEDGLRAQDGTYLIERRQAPRPFPLYRPFDDVNDHGEWANRYTVARIASGPNRGFWYVTAHTMHTDWGYAVTSYFNSGSPEGANPSNYLSFEPVCGGYVADENCYATTPLTCWLAAHPGQSYFEAAGQAINPLTGSPYDMFLLQQQVQTHEKQRHWQEFLVNEINANKTRFDAATVLEALVAVGSSEAAVRTAIDAKLIAIDFDYANDSNGGAGEVYNDPKTDFPLVEDMPFGTATCTLYHP